jgi:hypothetical protein
VLLCPQLAADVNPLVLAPSLLPFTFLLPSSPPTVLGGSAFYTCIIQKQKTHGAQSMGFEVIH